ncbi:MAG TPA: hypothetical protein VGL59_15295 [Polyangia bacterium]
MPPWAPFWLRRAAMVAGAAYLLAIWLDGAGTMLPTHVLPLPLRFFVQVTELFPNAAKDSIEWRVRGFSCARGRYEEIDVRPFFPIRSDDKESRFDRAMFFYHRHRRVMEAMDQYLTDAQNRLHPEARIGGVLMLSLRVPIPPLGTPGPRYQRLPIESYPPSVSRLDWYITDTTTRTRRCAEAP